MKSLSRYVGWCSCLVAFGVFSAGGCVHKDHDEASDAKKTDDSGAKAEGRKVAVLKASQDDCVGPLVRGKQPKEIAVGEHRFVRDGYLLTQKDSDPEKEIKIGILSDTKENSEANRRNLDRILDFFLAEKVEAIFHLGDVASVLPIPEEVEVPEKDENGKVLTAAEKDRIQRRMTSKARREAMSENLENITEMISVLADTDLPVFVIIGNRECKTTFNSAMATLAEDYPNVFNLNMIRRVDLDDLDIISMPGYHDPEYVHCAWDKCLYYESDTLSLIELAREANDPIMAVSHGPPRQQDHNAIDVVSEGANVGNPWLASALKKAGIAFGAFGNIQEAGGKATNLNGTSIVAQDKFVESLFLNPGPADSMAWSMNDGTESKGMAAVIHFVGAKAKYKIFRVGQQEAAASPAPAEKAVEKAAEKPAAQ